MALSHYHIIELSNYMFIHPSAIIDEGCKIGEDVRIWHFAHISAGSIIGDNSVIGQNVYVAANVVLGRNVHVQNNVSLYEGVVCEDDVFLGPSMVFTNIKNPRSAISRKGQYVKTIVRKGATIGANVTVVCGNEIGSYAMIGAGAVVTKNVLPYAMIIGNPGKQTGWVSEAGHRLDFDANAMAICPESKEKYSLKNNMVTKLTV